MSIRRRGVVIAWMPVSQRSATLARRLDYDLLLIGRSGFRRPWTAPFAYGWSVVRTISALVGRRPRAAIIVAPPFLAPLVAWPILVALRAPFAVDVHSGALLDRRWRWSVELLRWVARRSVAAIVTLETLRAPLAEAGVPTVVLADPLPDLVAPTVRARGEPPTVVAICGWAPDEPLDALVAAADRQPWRLVLTGRPRVDLARPANVELAGFLPDDAFAALVGGADAVVVLTTREDTLLSGAWEAIALGRPLVLSGTAALRMAFGDAPTYVGADAASIAAGIAAILDDRDAAARIDALRERVRAVNDAALAEVAARLATDQPSSAARSTDQAS